MHPGGAAQVAGDVGVGVFGGRDLRGGAVADSLQVVEGGAAVQPRPPCHGVELAVGGAQFVA